MVYNPFSDWPVTNSWAGHGSYSPGGIDYPLPYGTPLQAPASGTLQTTGGSGEFAAGWYGGAGRRSILHLDAPAVRQKSPEGYPPEGGGNMVAIVFQHQSAFGAATHYRAGETLGWSGASANGEEYGGDVHLHIHGLNAGGQRVDFLKFIDGSKESTDMAIAYPNRNDYRDTFNLSANQVTQLKNPNGSDMNIAELGHQGRLIVTSHIYAEAPAGNALDILLLWQNSSTGAISNHYVDRIVADRDNRIFANRTFQRNLDSNSRVFLRVAAPSSNTASIKVTNLAADATLFV